MAPDRWQRLQELFAQALARRAGERAAFVAAIAGEDAALAAELAALLAADPGSADPVPALVAGAARTLVAGDRDALIGQRLGAWRIVEHVADGGMGAVYRAERADGHYEQRAAVKLLSPALLSHEGRQRIGAERQILARLAHPLIARLLDGGSTDDGVPYLVMEYVDGEPIDAWCDRHGLDTAARLRLFVQVCQAVDFAHRNLVVHRDIKPGNILVDTAGVPRLLDFGIAKLVDAEGATRTGERLLTPSHASPEQIVGGPITTATDVYALGVLLYDLVAGRLPHAGASAAALARAIVDTDPPRPSLAVAGGSSRRLDAAQRRGERLSAARLARELEGDLDNIVLMALRKEPERRYASAQELADDVNRHLAHQPVRARADTLAYRGRKFVRRHPVAVPVSAAALVLALGGAAIFTDRLADERDRALAAERSARRSAEFSASLLRGTSADEDAARQVSVLDLLDKAARRVDDELGDDLEVASRVRLAIGSAYASWGANQRALAVLQTAEQASRAVSEPAALRQRADLLSQLSTVTHDLGLLDASLDWVRQADALWQQVGTPIDKGRSLSDLAITYNALRRRSEAEPVFRAAIAAQRAAGGDSTDLAWTLNNFSWCLHAMGRLDEAAPIYVEALGMQRRLGAPEVEIAQTLNNLAGVYYDRGQLDDAERLWTETLQHFVAVFGTAGHAAVARGENALALVALDRGRVADADRLSAQALAANLKLLGEKHRWTALTMQTRARALLELGRVDAAEAMLKRALGVLSQVLPAGQAQFVGPHRGLARVALARRDLAGAERELGAALAIIKGLKSPDRVPLEQIEWMLGRVMAERGRRAPGRALAAEAVAGMQQKRPASHYARRAFEAGIALPPFVEHPSAAARARAEATLEALRRDLGPDAPTTRELGEQLALVPPD